MPTSETSVPTDRVERRRERVERRGKVGDLSARGRREEEIAAELGVSSKTITGDLKVVHAKWLTLVRRDSVEVLAEQLAVLDQVQRSAWVGWERSWESTSRTTKGRKSLASGQQDHVATTEIEHQGDSKYLALVLHCIDRRCQLLGIKGKVPAKDVPSPPWAEITRHASDDELTVLATGFETATRLIHGESDPAGRVAVNG